MFDTLKKKISNAFNTKTAPSPVNVIENPLGIRIGSNINIKCNNALIYKIPLTKHSSYDIVAISKINISPVVTAFRFYDNKSVACKITPAENFIQILVSSRDNSIIECRLFQLIDEFFPATIVESKTWVGEEGSIIGSQSIDIDGVTYGIVDSWASGVERKNRGCRFIETIYEKLDGSIKSIAHHESMLYGKWAHEGNQIAEYVLASSTEVHIDSTSKVFMVGTNRLDGISLYRGIDIPLSDVVVNF